MSANASQIPQMPLSWQCGFAPQAGGPPACTVQLQHGKVAFALTLPPDDLERLGQALVSTAQQARSGLVVAAAMPPGNGKPPTS